MKKVFQTKIIIDTSVLISGSIYWQSDDKKTILKQKGFEDCDNLFKFLKEQANSDIGIITKTVEDESKNTLNRAVKKTVLACRIPDMVARIKFMTLQDVIFNCCLDRMETIVEECSTRLAINIDERNKLVEEEIEPFLNEIVKSTLRYIQPSIPKFIKWGALRGELTRAMVEALPSKGTIYKGMPEKRDQIIMAEASMIYQKYKGEKRVYLASLDRHFIPNKIQVGSYLSENSFYLDEKDTTIRDKIAKKFGFIGEEPKIILDLIRGKEKLDPFFKK